MRISDYIIEKNNQYLVAHKMASISVSPDHTGDRDLQSILSAYVKHDIHLITRLDKPVSGAVLYGLSVPATRILSEQLQDGRFEKTYVAFVEGSTKKDKEMLTHHLVKGRNNKAYVSEDKKSKKSVLTYQVVQRFDNYTCVRITTETGRFHQIRAQMAAIGHAIKGDVKYGARRGNKDRSIHLHAFTMSFDHPVSKERVSYQTDLPDDGLWNLIDPKALLNS